MYALHTQSDPIVELHIDRDQELTSDLIASLSLRAAPKSTPRE